MGSSAFPPSMGLYSLLTFMSRCNNVLWMSAAKGVELGDVKMEG